MAVLVGDCVELMRDLEASSIDAVVCDPPYGLEFMGKEWDRLSDQPGYVERGRITARPESQVPYGRGGGVNSYQAGLPMQDWHHAWATEALRVLKPGGHLLAFGGTRTSHRLACAIEDAGFEIRDTICWMYGSGFPKSLDVSKAIDKAAGVEREVVGERLSAYGTETATGDRVSRPGGGAGLWVGSEAKSVSLTGAPATDEARTWQGWGTALKPAHEPIVVARKPLVGTVAGNVLEHGTGALNVDGCRVEGEKRHPGNYDDAGRMGGARTMGAFGGSDRSGFDTSQGRWPANVVLDEEAAAMLDEQTGELGRSSGGQGAASGLLDGSTYGTFSGANKGQNAGGLGDSGGASRFFYVAKASRAERNAGLEGFEERSPWTSFDGQYAEGRNPKTGERTGPYKRQQGNHHPTVKPIALMRWLVRLVTLPGGLVLDPFAGSGTTGIAAGLEGFRFLGMEQDAAYAAIASARIAWWAEHGEEALRIVAERERAESERAEIIAAGQLELL